VNGSWVNIARQTKLLYIAEALEPGMLNQVIDKSIRQTDESVHGIIDDLSLVCQIDMYLLPAKI